MTRFYFVAAIFVASCSTAANTATPTTTTTSTTSTSSTTTTVPAPAPTSQVTAAEAPAPSRSGGRERGGADHVQAIAACESGGNPGAVSPSGKHRGKYQFDQRTWESVGGSGDPAMAPEGEQDARAAELYRRRGSQPWPSCG